jgi:hypothetical protein
MMGDNSLVEVTDKGRIELTNKSFENVQHIPKLSVNILSVYQMKTFGTRKRVIFKLDAMDIYDMQTNSRVSTSDERSRIWHERFGPLNFRYMKHIIK